MALSESRPHPAPLRGLVARLSGPGGLYNIGNVFGLASGIGLALAAAPGRASGAVIADYLAGSVSAVAITVAMLIFLASGEAYHRAWAHGAPPDAGLTRLGDRLSGWGALALFVGLFLVGEMVLALASGLLHAAGKFGSGLDHPAIAAVKGRRPDPFRVAVLVSRVPAMLLLGLALGRAALDPAPAAAELIAPASLLFCYLLWARADLLLFRS
jgi:hypothetical protein